MAGSDIKLLVTVDPQSTIEITNQIAAIAKGIQPIEIRAKLNTADIARVRLTLSNINRQMKNMGTISFGNVLKDAANYAKQIESSVKNIQKVANGESLSGGKTKNSKQNDAKQMRATFNQISKLDQKMFQAKKRLVDAQGDLTKAQNIPAIKDTIKYFRQQRAELLKTAKTYKEVSGYNDLVNGRVQALTEQSHLLKESRAQSGGKSYAASAAAQEAANVKKLNAVYRDLNATEKQIYNTRRQMAVAREGGKESKALKTTLAQLEQRKKLGLEQAQQYKTLSQYQALEQQRAQKQIDLQNKLAQANGRRADQQKTQYASLNDVTKAYNNLDKYINKNPKIFNTAEGQKLVRYRDALNGIIQSTDKYGNMQKRISTNNFDKMGTSITNLRNNLKIAGKEGQSLTQWLGNAYKKFGSWMLVTRSIAAVSQGLHGMVSQVTAIDTAMVELRKVTNETNETYQQFTGDAIKRAKTIGTSVADTISATADAARLGFDIKDASKLADATLVYKNVGDGIDSVDVASQSVISTMKAFGIQASDSMSIVDKFNEVSNHFAISAGGIGDALTRSSAALAAGNSTLDESIGLVVAANDVVQNPEVVGTTLKTISMYLRASKTEAEAAGESTEGMAESVSKLRGELLALTGGKVDIMLDEDTYKSPYQILKALSEVWNDLSDITQANITEKIGGKRNANVVSALLNNFATAEKVVETASHSAGSAMAENEKYLDSIEGKMSRFHSTLEGFSTTAFNTDFLKGLITFGDGAISVLTVLVDKLGAVPTLVGAITAAYTVLQNKGVLKQGKFFGTDENGAITFGGKSPKSRLENLVAARQGGASVSNAMKLSGTDVKQATTYINGYNQALDKSASAATKYINKQKQMQPGMKSWLKSLNGAPATLNGYAQSLNKVTIAEAALGKVKNIGASFASTVGNMMIGMGAAAAITMVISLISKAINSAEELRQKTADSALEFQQTMAGIGTVESEATDIVSQLESNTLSTQEAYDARVRLSEIQKEMIAQYGQEAASINLLNASVAETGNLFDKIEKKQAETFLSDNEKGIQQAQQKMDQTKTSIFTFSKENEDVVNALRKYAKDNDNISFKDDGKFIRMNVTGTLQEYQDAMENFREYVSGYSKQLSADGIDLDSLFYSAKGLSLDEELSSKITANQKVINEYKEIYDQANLAKIASKDEYSSIVDEITGAQNSFEHALYDNYSNEQDRVKALEAAFNQAASAREKFNNTDFGEDTGVRKYIDDMLNQLESAQSEKKFEIEVVAHVNGEESDIASQVESLMGDISEGLPKKVEANAADYADWIRYYKDEVAKAASYGLDAQETVFGNIDTNNRQRLEWTQQNVDKYKSALESWGDVAQDYLGAFSTVDAQSDLFKGIEIAFTPMLNTENGPEYLDKNTVYKYLEGIVDAAQKDAGEGNPISFDKIFELDKNGLEIEGKKISNMIAGVGEDARRIGEVMHYQGKDGSIQDTYREISKFAKQAGMDVDTFMNTYKDGASDLPKMSDIFKMEFDDLPQGYSDLLDIEKGSEAYNQLDRPRQALIDLSNAAKENGLSLNQMLQIWASQGYVVNDMSDALWDASQNITSANKYMQDAAKGQEALNAAFSSQETGNSVSLSAYEDLIAIDSRYAECLEKTAGGMRINVKAANELSDALAEQKLKEVELLEAQDAERYQNNAEKIYELQSRYDDLTNSEKVQLDMLQQQNSQIEANLAKYEILKNSIMELTSAYQHWQDAQNYKEPGAGYDDAKTARDQIKEALKTGKTGEGNYKFQAALEFLVPEESQAELAKYVKNTLGRYFTDDSTGVKNFMNDLVKNDLATLNNGVYEAVDGLSVQQICDKLKLTPEAVRMIFGELEEYEFDIKLDDSSFDQASMANKIENLEAEKEKIEQQIEDINAKEIDPKVKTEQLNEYLSKLAEVDEEQRKLELYQLPDQYTQAYNAVNDSTNPNMEQAKQDLDAITQKFNSLTEAERTAMGFDPSLLSSGFATYGQVIDQVKQDLEFINNANAHPELNLDTSNAQAELESLLQLIMGNEQMQMALGLTAETTDALTEQILNGEYKTTAQVDVEMNADGEQVEMDAAAKADELKNALLEIASAADTVSTKNIGTLGAEQAVPALQDAASAAKDLADSLGDGSTMQIKAELDTSDIDSKLSQQTEHVVQVRAEVSLGTAEGSMEAVANSVKLIGAAVDGVAGKSIGTLGAPAAVSALQQVLAMLASINGYSVTASVNVSTNVNSVVASVRSKIAALKNSFADGTTGAPGGRSLVGELGRELVVSNGRYYTVGERGAEFVNLRRGDIVFNHEDTERIFAGRGGARGTALAEGNAYAGTVSSLKNVLSNTVTSISGSFNNSKYGSSSSSSSSKKNSSSKSRNSSKSKNVGDATVSIDADTAALEKQLKDQLDKAEDELDRFLKDLEHKVFLLQHDTPILGHVDEIVDKYVQMQDKLHEQAEKYRAMGLKEDSKYLIDLSEKWYDYRDKVVKAIKEAYDATITEIDNSSSMNKIWMENAFKDIPKKAEKYTPKFTNVVAGYRQLQQEMRELSLSPSETIFGNIDTNNRQVLSWTEDNIDRFRSAVESWGNVVEDYAGSFSTVDGMSGHFGDDKNGFEVAFTPILNTENGPEYLDKDTVHNYINKLLVEESKMRGASDPVNFDKIFELDTSGLMMDGRQIRGLLAGIGDDAIRAGQAMHYVGDNGALAEELKRLKDYADEHNTTVLAMLNEQQNAYNRAYAEQMDKAREARDAQIANDREKQRLIHEEAERYRAMGFSDTSDEVSKLSQQWWDFEKDIQDIRDQYIEYIRDMVDATSDLVDEIQDVFDTLTKAAEEFEENGGYISVDTFQDITDLGLQNMQMLKDENGLLVINKERIADVMQARVEQLAVETALAYVEELRAAKEAGDIQRLNTLLGITASVTGATWDLVYANLALADLDYSQRQIALSNINTYRALAANVSANISKQVHNEKESEKDLKDGFDDFVRYVMDMLQDKIDKQIEALEKQKDAFRDIIDLKKKSLELTKKETDYEDKVEDKVKEIAKLQEKINALSLDDSREANAQKIKLLEQLYDLQDELADTQADHAYDIQTESLDEMQKAYEKQKDDEIEALKKTYSSKQKLYDAALKYIDDHYSTVLNEMIAWNTEYGNSLNHEIVSAWDDCTAAVQKYGSAVQAAIALQNVSNSSGSSGVLGSSGVIGEISGEDYSYKYHLVEANGKAPENAKVGDYIVTAGGIYQKQEDGSGKLVAYLTDYIGKPKASGRQETEQAYRAFVNAGGESSIHAYSAHLPQLLIANPDGTSNAVPGDYVVTGGGIYRKPLVGKGEKVETLTPYIGTETTNDYSKIQEAYEKVKASGKYKFHTGGIVGDIANMKQNEMLAILEKGEAVLDDKKEKALYKLVDFSTALSERIGTALNEMDLSSLVGRPSFSTFAQPSLAGVTPIQYNISIGDTIINGANEDTLQKHADISRKFVNEIFGKLNIRR